MKYYVVHVQTLGESEAKSIFSYETRDLAEIAFHQEVASDMSNPQMDKALVEIINETGAVEIVKCYAKPQPQPEPQPEPEPEPETEE